MKFSTLTHIHKLLQEDCELLASAWDAARRWASTCNGSPADRADAEANEEKSHQQYREAKAALYDFEHHEWK